MATTIHRPAQLTRPHNGHPARTPTVRRRTKPKYATLVAPPISIQASAPSPPITVASVTPAEAPAMCDRISRRELRISSPEFLRQWDAGVYRSASDDEAAGRAILRIARLVP